MEQKRLFIYDRREVIILILLGAMVAMFAFTLGIHLGKKVNPRAGGSPISSDSVQVPTLQDNVPNKQELTEQSRGAQATADDELTKTLQSEVEKSGMKLNTPRQVTLPEDAKSKNAGATTLNHLPETAKQEEASVPTGKFTLQVGSYGAEEEAKEQIDSLRSHGLKPFLRSAQVRGLGMRYRLFVGGFATRDEAQSAGRKFQSEHVIRSFLISNLTDNVGG
jgi:cell division protein FtsN